MEKIDDNKVGPCTSSDDFLLSLNGVLQGLCNGFLKFHSEVELIGYINICYDKDQREDFVLRQVLKKKCQDSTTAKSYSYIATEKAHSGKETECLNKQSNVKDHSDASVQCHLKDQYEQSKLSRLNNGSQRCNFNRKNTISESHYNNTNSLVTDTYSHNSEIDCDVQLKEESAHKDENVLLDDEPAEQLLSLSRYESIQERSSDFSMLVDFFASQNRETEIEKNKRSFTCDICSRIFEKPEDLSEHFNAHKVEDCKHEPASLEDYDLNSSNIQKEQNIPQQGTELVQNSSTSDVNSQSENGRSIDLIARDKKEQSVINQEQYKCEICRSIFKSALYLKVHLRAHRSENTNCTSNSDNQMNLSRHHKVDNRSQSDTCLNTNSPKKKIQSSLFQFSLKKSIIKKSKNIDNLNKFKGKADVFPCTDEIMNADKVKETSSNFQPKTRKSSRHKKPSTKYLDIESNMIKKNKSIKTCPTFSTHRSQQIENSVSSKRLSRQALLKSLANKRYLNKLKTDPVRYAAHKRRGCLRSRLVRDQPLSEEDYQHMLLQSRERTRKCRERQKAREKQASLSVQHQEDICIDPGPQENLLI